MKITQDFRTKQETSRSSVRPSVKEGTDFSGLVQEGKTRIYTEALDRLFADIQKQADRVMHSRTVADFLRFKRQVEQFVKEAVGSGLELRKSYDWHYRGGTKTFTTVKKINETLTELTDQFLHQKQPAVDLLAKIGEIQGLLINLYR